MKNKLKFSISLILLSIFSSVLMQSHAQESDSVVMENEAKILLQDFMTNAKTLRADFSQMLIDEDGNMDESANSTGVFLLERPGKFRWQITAPNVQLILADGKNLWNYDVDLEQATVKPMDETLNGTPAMLLSGEEDVLEAFNVNGSFVTIYGDEKVQWLELIPKKSHDDFSKIRLGFNDKDIRIMELTSNVGQVVRIEFLSVARNIELDDKLFMFTAPDHVDIIGDAL